MRTSNSDLRVGESLAQRRELNREILMGAADHGRAIVPEQKCVRTSTCEHPPRMA